jgi:hypothetical protein
MGKLLNFISLMSGLVLIFYFGGMLTGTATSELLSLSLDPSNLQNRDWVKIVFSVSAVVISLASTFVSRSINSDFFLMIPFVTIFLNFGWDFLVIYQTLVAQSEISGLIGAMVFGPLMLMYVVAVVEWWRGLEA